MVHPTYNSVLQPGRKRACGWTGLWGPLELDNAHIACCHTADIPGLQRLVERRRGTEHLCAVGKGGSAHMKRPASGEGDGTTDASSQEGRREACGQHVAKAAESSAGMSPPTHHSLLADCATSTHLTRTHRTYCPPTGAAFGPDRYQRRAHSPNRSSLAASPLETMPLKAIPPPSRLLHAAYYSPQPLPRTATHQWYTLLTTRYCSQGAREHVAGLDCGDRSNWTMLTRMVVTLLTSQASSGWLKEDAEWNIPAR